MRPPPGRTDADPCLAPSLPRHTQAVISDRLKVSGSLARRAIAQLHADGVIRPVSTHGSMVIYTRNVKAEEEEETAAAEENAEEDA